MLAVSVYVVVCDGETWSDVPVTTPIPLIEIEVALATDQESVALSPASKGEIDAGEAMNEETVGTVALLPVNETSKVEVDPIGGTTSSVCPGTSCIAGIVCDSKVVAIRPSCRA